jgi:hypothetical protein
MMILKKKVQMERLLKNQFLTILIKINHIILLIMKMFMY